MLDEAVADPGSLYYDQIGGSVVAFLMTKFGTDKFFLFRFVLYISVLFHFLTTYPSVSGLFPLLMTVVMTCMAAHGRGNLTPNTTDCTQF